MKTRTQGAKHMAALNEVDSQLITSVANKMNLQVHDVISESRRKEIVDAKKVLSLLFYNRGYTFVRIADIIRVTQMNHTSVINLLKKAKFHYTTEEDFAKVVDEIMILDDIKRRHTSNNSDMKSEIAQLKKNIIEIQNLTKMALSNMENLGIWDFEKEAKNL